MITNTPQTDVTKSYWDPVDTPRTDALMNGGCYASVLLEHTRELEREVNELNQRIIAIKGTQASLIAAINFAINEYKGSSASVYLNGIMQNLFSK